MSADPVVYRRRTSDNEVDVSIVLPVFNDVDRLEHEVRKVRTAMDASQYTYEVIVVDDGSTDGSAELLTGIDGIRLLAFAQHRGGGAARKYGTLSARGRNVVWTDVDGSNPNDQIPALVDQMDGWDQVVGHRTGGAAHASATSLGWAVRKLASHVTRSDIPDLDSSFRAFRRSVALQFLYLLSAGAPALDTMTTAFLVNGYSVRFVPIRFDRRSPGSDSSRRSTRGRVLGVIRMALLHEPLRVLGPLTALLLVAGAAKLAYDLLADPAHVAGTTLVLLGIGLSLGVLAMLADLLGQLNKRRHDVIPATVEKRVRSTNLRPV